MVKYGCKFVVIRRLDVGFVLMQGIGGYGCG